MFDDQGQRVEYFFDYRGRLLEARTNESFHGPGNLVAYLGTVYTFDSNGANPPLSRDLLARIRNTWNWLDAMGQWQSQVRVQNDYTYSDAGNRLTNTISDHTGPLRTELYVYDELSRLSSVNYGDGETQGYTFDAMGNRLTKTDNVTGNETYTVNAANMLLSRNGNAYTNDTNGNTLTGGGRTNTWDGANRLTQCVLGSSTTSHTSGADGFRHRTVQGANTTDFILDGQSVVRTFLNGAVDKTFLSGPRGPEYERTGAGAPLWNLYDGLGSVLGTVDAAGNVVSARKYDVYGAVRGLSGPSATKHKFVGSLGHPSEDETGLIYMRARYYDPVTGRFLSEDPAKQSANWFQYASGDPTNRQDASGRVDLPLLAAGILLFLNGFYNSVTFQMLVVLAFADLLSPGFGETPGLVKSLLAGITGLVNNLPDQAWELTKQLGRGNLDAFRGIGSRVPRSMALEIVGFYTGYAG